MGNGKIKIEVKTAKAPQTTCIIENYPNDSIVISGTRLSRLHINEWELAPLRFTKFLRKCETQNEIPLRLIRVQYVYIPT